MNRGCVIITFIVIGCLLVFQSSCQPTLGESQKAAAEEQVSLAEQTGSPGSQPAPKIEFENVVHNFGEIGPGSTNSCDFKFKNTGGDLLKITNVSKTCGCTPYTLEKREYVPGEEGVLKVRYVSGRYSGPATRRLFVYSNDKTTPKVTLTVKAQIVPKVDCEPKQLKLSLKEENAGCPDIVLTSTDGQPFAIKWFRSTLSCITVDYNIIEKATKFVLKPKVDVEKLQAHPKGNIQIDLSHPGCKKITIPFHALSRFKVSPPAIIEFNVEPQKPRRKELWVLNNYNEDFEIKSVSSGNGFVKVLSQEKHRNRYKLELEITAPKPEDGRKDFTDTILIDIRGGEELKVNCRGFYSRKQGGQQADTKN